MWKRTRKKAISQDEETWISEHTVIDGNVLSQTHLRIAGKVNGDVTVNGDVSIGPNGSVRSIVTAHNVHNAGLIDGSVHVLGKLAITNKGRVHGEIAATSISISEGGLFNGTCLMTNADRSPTLDAPHRFTSPNSETARLV